MSELITCGHLRPIRWQLLSTASAVALIASISGTVGAEASDDDADRPTVWIELGTQMDHIAGQGDPFTVGFLAANPNSPVLQPTTPFQAQRPIPFSFAEDGKISIQPENSNWVFSVAVNYGRSGNTKHVDHQTKQVHYQKYKSGVPTPVANLFTQADFADTHVHRQESHTILDFAVGKDVGLGLFGSESTSVLGFGVRFAQFTSKSTFDVRARPDLRIKYFSYGPTRVPFQYFHTYHASGQSSRSFHGVGPTLTWSGSAPVIGNMEKGEVLLDWGANVAVLFGRQKARVRHHESAHYRSGLRGFQFPSFPYTQVYDRTGGRNSARSVVVPNVGGFAGASYRIENFKVSLGYRADFFFGAIDGGVDTRKSETIGFYGPFASVSVGLGG